MVTHTCMCVCVWVCVCVHPLYYWPFNHDVKTAHLSGQWCCGFGFWVLAWTQIWISGVNYSIARLHKIFTNSIYHNEMFLILFISWRYTQHIQHTREHSRAIDYGVS